MKTEIKSSSRWMVVDDAENILSMMRDMGSHLYDAEVECFSSPRAALKAFRKKPDAYDVVIIDFQMPDMNGVELCHEMRKISHAKKIFLLTGTGLFTDACATRAGFDGLLNKPFSHKDLRALVGDGEFSEARIASA